MRVNKLGAETMTGAFNVDEPDYRLSTIEMVPSSGPDT